MDSRIRFEEYASVRAEGVAAMWRESREGWPPGFMGASVFTPESVEWEERASGSLFTVLALAGERVVGLCRTTPWGGEPDAAYVGLLTVVPDLHGRKIGRDLLLDAIGRTAALGLRRIDLNTWPANLKAMPLYKKTGFFWVPDTQVTMQNYMPFLLGRPELAAFLDGTEWYGCLERELSLRPDEERTPSGREVFTYLFRRDGRTLRAVFDRRGRILSGLHSPDLDLSVERDAGPVWFGRSVAVVLSGPASPRVAGIAADPDLELPSTSPGEPVLPEVSVTPLPVAVTVPARDRSPRVVFTVPTEPPLEIGLGLRAEEPVSLASPPVLWMPPDRGSVPLDLLNLSGAAEVRIRASLDGRPCLDGLFPLEPAVFQRLELPLPVGRPGEGHARLALILESSGVPGAEESLVLTTGRGAGPARWILTRTHAVAVSGRLAAVVSRRGLQVELLAPDRRLETVSVAGLQVQAGPPFWNSDLPHQVYRLAASGEWLTAEAEWPSRSGLSHECRLRLDAAGFVESVSSLHNASDAPRSAHFSCDWEDGAWFRPATVLYPLPDGLFGSPEVDNQVPDIEEDLPKRTSELAAPWLGRSSAGRSLMISFPGWPELRYDQPESGELTIPPGARVETPPLRLLSVTGGREELLAAAASLGWPTGGAGEASGFLAHGLLPVMGEGEPLQCSHRLLGLRAAELGLDGDRLAAGDIRTGALLSAVPSGTGLHEVSVEIAGRTFGFPVLFLGHGETPVEASREGDGLVLRNARITARIAPAGFGHVHSLLLDGVESLRSAHPGPSVFEWESPWYGGIHPRICDDRGAPFRLDWREPSVEPFQETEAGVLRKGWNLSWTVDHKRFGSYRLRWLVSMLPGVPLLRTVLLLDPLAGGHAGTEADLRGFVAPGGTVEGSVLTCEASARLSQGRDHAGAWAPAGSWARISGPGGSFVEAHAAPEGVLWYEDYADSGCHLSLISEADGSRRLRMDWLFGSSGADRELAAVLRAHGSGETSPQP